MSADSPHFLRYDIPTVKKVDITSFLNNSTARITPVPVDEMKISAHNKVACLLYTSGTTGHPKGVRVTQESISAFVCHGDAVTFGPGDRVSQITNLAWDAHILETWGPLLRGATICSFDRFDVLDPLVLTTLFNAIEVSHSFMTCAMLRHVLGKSPGMLQSLKLLVTGGDSIRYDDYLAVRDVNPELIIQHVYGPSECCVFTVFNTTQLSSQFPTTGTVPIGKPLVTTQVVLLDPNGRLVPPLICGEIHIRGSCIADGYEGQEQETKAAFIPKQITSINDNPSLFYRTNDKATWTSSGQLEFLGRLVYNQVKVRGQRLEVDEVEANIVKATQIGNVAVAYYRGEYQRNGALLGYLVPGSNSPYWQHLERDESVVVETWEEYYDVAYTTDDIVSYRKAFIGWDSMITGQPIPQDEMECELSILVPVISRDDADTARPQAWLMDTLRPFFAHKPQQTFEVGCGIGIIINETVQLAKHSFGIEPSTAGLQKLQAQLSRDGLAEKASLWHASVDQIQTLPDFETDFILINSVAQYFPSLQYLENAIRICIDRCGPGGHIMLGDLRSAPLNDLLVIDILLHQWKDCLDRKNIRDLRQEVHRKQQYATELLVDPMFFFQLQQRDSRITHVEVLPKIMGQNNELSRYRYQVVLHIQAQVSFVYPNVWESPKDNDPTLMSLTQLVRQFVFSDHAILAIERIPNRFLTGHVQRLQVLRAPSTHQLTSLTEIISSPPQAVGWSASDLSDLATLHGLSLQLSYARQQEGGILDAVFTKVSTTEQRFIFPQSPTADSSVSLNPEEEASFRRKKLDDSAFETITKMLKAMIPDFMIPELLYIIDHIPLTKNGKIDRKVLANIAASDYGIALRKEAEVYGYSNETEREVCDVFTNLLGSATAVSPATDFFRAGGHSLLATQLRSKLQEIFQVSLSIRQIFDAPTAAELSAVITKSEKILRQEPLYINNDIQHGALTELSNAQFRVWFQTLLNPKDPWYNSGFTLRFARCLHEEVLERTLNEIVMRHEILRTLIVEQNGVPMQLLTDQIPHLEKIDLLSLDDIEHAKASVREHLLRPFDLDREIPIRPVLFRRGEQHILLISIHHIATDGFSHDIWRRELTTIYPAMLAGESSPLRALHLQYNDFAMWQRSEENRRLVDSELDYWIPYLKGSRPARLPVDFTRSSAHSEAGTSTFECDQELKDRLQIICKNERVTWFMLLIAAFRALQFQWTGQSDASLGNPIANRHHSEFESLLGFFVNTQVVRLKCQNHMPFLDLLRQTRDLTLKAFDHQHAPFEKIVETLNPSRYALQNPLVEIMFAFQTTSTAPFNLAGIPVSYFGINNLTTRFDLEVHWEDRPDHLRCVMFYRLDVFKASTIEKFGHELVVLLETIADNADTLLMTDHLESETIELESYAPLPEFLASVQGPDGPPQNATERTIISVFEIVLGQEELTRQSHFFELGGHSLLVTLACSKLKKALLKEVKIVDIFSYPTPAALAIRAHELSDTRVVQMPTPINSEDKADRDVTSPTLQEMPPYYRFRTLPGKPLLFCLPMATGIGSVFARLALKTDEFCTVAMNDPFLNKAEAGTKSNGSSSSMEDLAASYYKEILNIEENLNRSHPSEDHTNKPPPLSLLGYSFGGNVAIEVARLAQRDHRAVNLFLIDSAVAKIPSTQQVIQQSADLGFKDIGSASDIEAKIQSTIAQTVAAATERALSSLIPRDTSVGGETEKGEGGLEKFRECAEINVRRLLGHEMGFYEGNVTLFRSESNVFHGLGEKVRRLEEVALQGGHYELLDYSKEQREAIADRISSVLNGRRVVG
ncbi:NRPS [Bacidia gigantensis]|uniref:NRPS n=1 Tax=Bacidia gigantensis TaxID=2732470 RepID=UPI001D036C34|nr:NRPS [Bacidia gigantensis]KAG8528559.1 NRPS [Bacidia gigantensis]